MATACDDPASLRATSVEDSQRLRSIQLYSTAHSGHLSIDRQQRLKKIHQADVFSSADRSFEGKLSNEMVIRPAHRLRSAVTKVMLARKATAPRAAQIQAKMSAAAANVIAQGIQSTVVVEATTTLFRTEMLLLAEYRECIIPLFYAFNMVFVWLSQNATYYTNTEAVKTTDDLLRALLSILVLFGLEFASFMVLSVVLWRRLRLSPLHQLAFVLERQATLIRANMLFALVLTLTFNLVHAGVDFSFEFKWLAGIPN